MCAIKFDIRIDKFVGLIFVFRSRIIYAENQMSKNVDKSEKLN